MKSVKPEYEVIDRMVLLFLVITAALGASACIAHFVFAVPLR